ncbi:MAG: PIG-L family deacetylase [Methanobrevibacter sp.]|jgi:LmbE family N-acetylglucosaminyl deacetylase|nr:PIG-L family deacetylase [Candidatus Methanovirga australis]
MKKLDLFIVLFAAFILFLSTFYSVNPFNAHHEKIAFIIPHADDETIGASGIILMLLNSGYKLHFDLMTSGNGIGSNTLKVHNYYNCEHQPNESERGIKGRIREDSFKQVMKIINVTDYKLHGIDDGALNTDQVFSVMENLYLKEGYKIFYTTTGDRNPDHHACHEAMKRMHEKHPNLKYRQFPIYYYFYDHGKTKPTQSLFNNFIDVGVDVYAGTIKEMFQVYYNIHTILPTFYPRSNGVISFSPERIYYDKI